MQIPNFVSSKFVDENGFLTAEWSNILTQLITELQLNLNNEGYVLPQQPTSNIAKLTDSARSTGALIYDSTTNEVKANISGTWKIVTVV